jgi:thermostable 8-oxoguanine DNA glycosylase
MEIEGIGPKTASWIVRNWLGSDDVAILDIHVIRACQAIGVFPSEVALSSEYAKLEQRFLDFSKGLGVRASILDAVIWHHMREFTPRLLQKLT